MPPLGDQSAAIIRKRKLRKALSQRNPMSDCKRVRTNSGVSSSVWEPNSSLHWLIQNFSEDALACLFGRLMLRYAAQIVRAIHLLLTTKDTILSSLELNGRQFVSSEQRKESPTWLSHRTQPSGWTSRIRLKMNWVWDGKNSLQGDYVGFASSCSSKVGVDIMRLDKESK